MNKDEKRGKLLRKLRKRKNMTQQELAKLIHYSDKNISKWEKGKSFPINPNTINQLAEIFEVSIEEIMFGELKEETNTEKINSNFKNVYLNTYNHHIKIIKTLVIIFLFLIVLLFILIYQIYIKNSVGLYSGEINNENIKDTKVLVLLTNKIHFLNFNQLESVEKDIKEISMYFYKNNKKKLIFTGDNHNYYIKDKYGYDEYDLQNAVKSTCYLHILYSDGTKETIKFRFKKEYNNDQIFPSSSPKNSKESELDDKKMIDKLIELGFEEKNVFLTKEWDNNVVVQYNKDSHYLYVTFINGGALERISAHLLDDRIYYEKENGNSLTKTEVLSISGQKNCDIEECQNMNDFAMYIHFLKDN